MRFRPVPNTIGLLGGFLLIGGLVWEHSVRAANSARQEPATPIATEEVGAALFEEQVAPLLARSCLDCHDPRLKKRRTRSFST